MALNVKRIASTTAPGRHGDGKGLYLKVSPGGSKSWIFRFERGGRERFMGLGSTDLVSLAEARDLALAARKQLLAGVDPISAREQARADTMAAENKRITFADATQQYFDLHQSKWKNAKHRAQFLSTLRDYAFPTLGKVNVDAIDTAAVLRVLDSIWHKKPETASRVRQRIEKVLAWAIVRGYRAHPNPAQWVGHLKEALPARNQIAKPIHHAALPYNELPAFMGELGQREGFAARALEFLILTAARTGEVTGATWDEIDFDTATWTIPEGRMKASKEHRVPLSEPAVALLKALPREGDYIFPSAMRKGDAMSNMAMATVLKRMGRTAITVHGFRSTFRDWAAETTAFPNHVLEQALAHVIGNKAEAAYRRGDLFKKRCQLMAAWAKYCASQPRPTTTTANVVSIRAA